MPAFAAPAALVALVAVVAWVPAAFAVAGARGVPPASHDEELVRVVGLGGTGIFRGIDALIAAPARIVPVGTLAFRATFAGAVLTGLAALLVFVLARTMLTRAFVAAGDEARSEGVELPKVLGRLPLATVLAAVAAWSATLGPAFQSEGAAPGGATLGALLVLSALACHVYVARWPVTAFVLGLAVSHSLPVACASLLVLAPRLAGLVRAARDRAGRDRMVRESATSSDGAMIHEATSSDGATSLDRWAPGTLTHAAAAFVLGLAPFVVAFSTELRDPSSWLGSFALGALGDSSTRTSFVHRADSAWLWSIARSDIGVVAAVFAVAGVVRMSRTPRARPVIGPIAAVVVAGVFDRLCVASVGTTAVDAVTLSAIAAVFLFAAVGLAWVVSAIARMPTPFAHASASLVVVLELVLPIRIADDTAALRSRGSHAGASPEVRWSHVAWSGLPPEGAFLIDDPRMLARMTAARITGDGPVAGLVVPTFALNSPRGRYALASESKLTAIYRDFALGSPPEELSFSTLASSRPLALSFDPAWDPKLARHLVPSGLLTSYEPEPRGASERRRALDVSVPAIEALAKVVTPSSSPELAAITARLFQLRALTLAVCNEREALARVIDDLTTFSPDDPLASALTRRLVTTKGTIDVRGLGR